MIIQMPMPARLALPLPPSARVFAQKGDAVCAGQALAGGRLCANVLAPASGVAGGVERLPVLGENGKVADAPCLLLERARPAAAPPANTALSPPRLLRQAGVVGLGGAGFPAWRKWRRGLRLFVANAVESDERLSCDKALTQELGAPAVLQAAREVAAVFAAPLVVAVGRCSPLAAAKEARHVGDDYAAGNERLLLRALLGEFLPPNLPPADCGYVCFNLATVIAMHRALQNGEPLLQRVVTLRANGRAFNVRVPFGASVADAAAALGLPAPPPPLGEARLAAASALVDLQAPPPPPALPCIGCAACDAVCPVGILPMRLHAALQDNNLRKAAAERLPNCLLCRRCDAVCPSAIGLTAQFAGGRRALAAKAAAAAQRQSWQNKHDRRQRRLAAPPPPAAPKPNFGGVVASILAARK